MDWFNTGLSRELAYGVAYPAWPNLLRLLQTMKERPAYASTHAAFHGALGQARPAPASAEVDR